MLRSKFLCPPDVGTSENIPEDVCTVAHLERTNVVAWVTVDEEFYHEILTATCCQYFGKFLFPCFWPHLLICWPYLLVSKMSMDRTIINTYWVLTNNEVKVIVMSYEVCCCYRKGAQVQSIPLDGITDCGISAPDTVCCNWDAAIPSIYIDTASSYAHNSDGGNIFRQDATDHEAVGYGLSGYAWFASEISARRIQLRGQNQHIPGSYAEMDRGDQHEPISTVKDRLQQIKDLHNGGMLTDVEYETKRQDIIASI